MQRLNLKLAHKNQELDAILHTAPDIIFSRHADGDRDYISDRFYEYTGAASGSANGVGWMDYVHPEDRDEADCWLERCVKAGRITKPNTGSARKMAASVGFVRVRCPFEMTRARYPVVRNVLRHS